MFKDTHMNQSFFYIPVPGFIAILLTWILYAFDESSALLGRIVSATESTVMVSSHFPVLSSILSSIVKLAPLFAVIFCFREDRAIVTRMKVLPLKQVLLGFFLGLFVFAVFSTFFQLIDSDLAERERGIFRYISSSEPFLVLFYGIVFFGYYCLTTTCIIFSIIIPVIRIIKKRG